MENEQENMVTGGVNEGELSGIKLENETLKRELLSRDARIAGLEKTLEEAKQAVVEASVDLSQTIAAYKTVTLKAYPGLVPDMVKGSTVAEIDASVNQAQALMEKVRREIAAENFRVGIPAGSPPRTLSDYSALSAREKIKLAVENR